MLLAIAFAHAPLFVAAIDRGPALLNGVSSFLHTLFVSNHARPMFAFLFGYSLVQLLTRQTRRGGDWVSVRKLLRRRGWWLIVFGLVHTLLMPLDILAVYGMGALLVVGLLRARDATLLWTAGLALLPATLSVGFGMWNAMDRGISTFEAGSVVPTAGLVESLVARAQILPFSLVFATVSVIPAMILGIWAARRRVLDEPERHRGFLVRTAVVATAVSIAGGLPMALIQTGVWAAPSGAAVWAAALAQPLTGYFGGIAMAGIIALIAIRVGRRRGALTIAVEALGQRSMSFYLFQSVAFVAVFHPDALGLQDRLGLAGAMGVAVATWLVSLLLAELMRRAGYRGPAENLLRRLSYGRRRPEGRAA
nr:DUF418 domain-containing protein [Allonocardiopsis opalescens]